MGRNILLGFAGQAEVSPTNVKDLLGDYLGLRPPLRDDELPDFPDDVDEIRAVLPVDAAYLGDTVELLWEWTHEYADFPYEVVYDTETRDNRRILAKAKEKIQSRNVSMALVDRLVEGKAEGDEVALIVAWGGDETADEHLERLVILAQTREIKVMDITAGLDDQPKMEELVFGDDEPEPEPERPRRRTAKDRSLDPEPAPEPEAEEEQPRRRRGKPRTSAQAAPEPVQDAEPESVEAEVSLVRQKAQKATQPLTADDDVILKALLQARALVTGLDASHSAMTLNDDRGPCELYKLLGRAIDKYTATTDHEPEEEPQEPATRRGGGRPRKDGTAAQPRSRTAASRTEWQDEDGEWHQAGRGRLPKGVPTRKVDPKTRDVIPED